MRPGPSITDLSGAMAVGARVDIIRAGRVLAADIEAHSVTLEWAHDKNIPGKLTFDAPLDLAPAHPMSPLALFGQRALATAIMANQDGRRWEIPLGQFVLTDADVGQTSVKVTAMDLMQILDDDPMPLPSSPAPGVTLRQEAQRLAGGIPVVLDAGVRDRLASPSAQWGASRTEAIRSLCASANAGIRAGADGCLHIHPLRHAAHPDAIYRPADLLVEVEPAEMTRRPNRWVVVGTSGSGPDEQRFIAVRTATDWPYETAGYGQITRIEQVSSSATQAAVDAAADEAMREDLASSTTRTIMIAADPRIEVGDIVAALAEDGEAVVGRVQAYSLPVDDPTKTMRIDIGVLEF